MKIFKSLIIMFATQLIMGQDSQDFLPLSLNLEENLNRETVVLPNVNVQELIEEDEKMSFFSISIKSTNSFSKT